MLAQSPNSGNNWTTVKLESWQPQVTGYSNHINKNHNPDYCNAYKTFLSELQNK